MDGKAPIVESKDILDALDTIKAVEMVGFALEEQTFKLKWSKAIFHCMDILRNIHDDLVSRLPPDVIAKEQAKANPSKAAPSKIITPDTVTAGAVQ
jgi:hypothetical protein